MGFWADVWDGVRYYVAPTAEHLETKTDILREQHSAGVDLMKARAEGKMNYALASQELRAAEEAFHPFTFRGRISNFIKKPIMKGVKGAGWAAAGLAAVGGLAYLANKSKNERKLDPDVVMANADVDMPPVLPSDALMAPENGAKRAVVGDFTRKYLAGKGGIDTASPNVMGANGLSSIDGRPVEDLKPASPAI